MKEFFATTALSTLIMFGLSTRGVGRYQDRRFYLCDRPGRLPR